MIALPRPQRITQGTVFCGALAEDYISVPVWGIVITARCDTVHEKTPIVNYLPAVRIEDWIHRHGGLAVIDRALSDALNRFTVMLDKRELSASLMEVHSPTEIAKVHFASPPNPLENKKTEKEAKEALQALNLAIEIERLRNCLEAEDIDSQIIASTLVPCHKFINAVIKDLLSHKMAGYYYIPDFEKLTENASQLGYVVLLREVHHLNKGAVKPLINGITKRDIGTPPQGLCFDCFDFVYPVAEIQSPWVEHLMQAFCTLFGRIGITDIDKTHTASVAQALTPKPEHEVSQ
jgi:hypothetical protein